MNRLVQVWVGGFVELQHGYKNVSPWSAKYDDIKVNVKFVGYNFCLKVIIFIHRWRFNLGPLFCLLYYPSISSACLQFGLQPPPCFLIFSLKGSCRSNLLFPETGVKGWGITALPPQCYKSLAMKRGEAEEDEEEGEAGREGEAQGTRDSQVHGSAVKPDTMELCGWGISLLLPVRGVFIMHTGGGEGEQQSHEGSEATRLRFEIMVTRWWQRH